MTSPPDFSVNPTLVGALVLLRPFQMDDDAAAMRAVLLDPETNRLTGGASSSADVPTMDAAAEERMLAWYRTRNEQSDRIDLAIVDRSSMECVGEIVLNQWDPGNRRCNLRIAVGPAGRNRGLGTEAVRLVLDYGFEQLALHRISLDVFSFNPRAARVYEKAGFVAEGVLREELCYDGEWIDSIVMSILEQEWRERRAASPAPSGAPTPP